MNLLCIYEDWRTFKKKLMQRYKSRKWWWSEEIPFQLTNTNTELGFRMQSMYTVTHWITYNDKIYLLNSYNRYQVCYAIVYTRIFVFIYRFTERFIHNFVWKLKESIWNIMVMPLKLTFKMQKKYIQSKNDENNETFEFIHLCILILVSNE